MTRSLEVESGMHAEDPTHRLGLHRFLADMTQLVDRSPPEDALLEQASALLRPLLAHDDWLPAEFTQAHPQHLQQYLIYADPQARFSLVSLVLGPGHCSPIHDHTVWGLSGVLKGNQSLQSYSRMADGRWVPVGLQIDMQAGDIEAASPRLGDVHKVWNPQADQACVVIEIYGHNIGGLQRHLYREDGSRQAFVHGYANGQSAPVRDTPSASAPSVSTPSASKSSTSTAPSHSVAPSAQAPKPVTQAHNTLAPVSLASDENPLPSPPTDLSMDPSQSAWPLTSYAQVQQAWAQQQELALVDVRDAQPHAVGHPLFAMHLPYGRTEADAWRRIPRLDTPLVLIDSGEGLASRAAEIYQRMGYTRVSLLQNGLSGWAAAGGATYTGLHTANKVLADLTEAQRKTPTFSAHEVHALCQRGSDVLVLDIRLPDEQTQGGVPGATALEAGDLVWRARAIAPKATTRLVVCGRDRTQSLIGAQSLLHAGLPNPVCALRHGMQGWMAARLPLAPLSTDTDQQASEDDLQKTKTTALSLLFRSGVSRLDQQGLQVFLKESHRTTFLLDVRSPHAYAQGHWPGALNAPAGKLVEHTAEWVGVRGARLVLYDDDGVRASVAASWLAQMGWECHVLTDVQNHDLRDTETPLTALPDPLTPVPTVDPVTLKAWLANRSNLSMVIDVGDSQTYVKRHIPGAWWLLRSQLAKDFSRVHRANRYILTCADGRASRYAVEELKPLIRSGVEVFWLPGGNASWMAHGFSTQQGESYVASPRLDVPLPLRADAMDTPAGLEALDADQANRMALARKEPNLHFKII